MFVMTCDIRIGGYNVKPAGIKWKCSVLDIVDTCAIQLPRLVYMPNALNATETPDDFVKLQYMPFKEGDTVEVYAGYNGKNELKFKGFLKRINMAAVLTLDCEGYSYPLNNVVLTKSYASTTVRDILKDLTAGTAIKISKYTADIPLRNVSFKNYPGMKVLEWFKKECLASVYFDFDELYIGATNYAIPKPAQRLQLGWNTVNDDSFKKDVGNNQINIEIVQKASTGKSTKTKSKTSKYSATKEVKIRAGLPAAFVKAVAEKVQQMEKHAGYKGSVTCFLEPHFNKGYVAQVTDKRFPERQGSFFVDTVEGSFDESGGRQKITLNYFGNVDG